MKKILLLALFVSVSFFYACEDEETFDVPTVTAPSGTPDVEYGGTVDVTFNFTADAGFQSSSVTATNGSATITTDGTADAKSGSIVVSFSAGTEDGAASVVLTVTDKESKSANATAVLNILEEVLVIEVGSNITTNTTWETGKTYILQTRVAVVSGVTLTIEPGVVVKGEAGTGANATALLIARGAKLMAEGTAAQPIIFTSVADEIEPGMIESPNLDPDINGLWGGLLILGKAKISADAESIQIEGIPASDPNGLYGGTDDADNSGVIKYISLRHGGANIGEGNEINGLTLGGVGSGTVIENVEIVANQDDGIEWFGGAVSVTNAIVWNTGDDAVDTDQGWSGTLDNFIVINPGDECFELDGGEGAFTAQHIIKNGWISAQDAEGIADLDNKGVADISNSNVDMSNIYFKDITSNEVLKQDFDDYPVETVLSDLEATLPDGVAVTAVFKKGSDAAVTVVAEDQNTVGPDVSKFAGWSWAVVSGALE